MNRDDDDRRSRDDAELRRRLLDEIPEPGAGYWEAIDGNLESGDSGRSVMRLTDMVDQPDNAARRFAFLAAAAAAVLVVGGVIVVLSRSDTTVDVAANTATDGTGAEGEAAEADETATTDPSTEEPPSADGTAVPDPADAAEETAAAFTPGSSCYLGDETPAGLVVRLDLTADGRASAATYHDGNDEPDITVAEGRLLDDGHTLQMSEIAIGRNSDGVARTVLWQLDEGQISLAEDVAAPRLGDCDAVAEQLSIIDQTLAINPVDPAQPGAVESALAAGEHCYVDNEGHPADDYVKLIVAEDGTVTVVTRGFEAGADEPAALGEGLGSFSSATEIVVSMSRRSPGGEPSTQNEVWRIDGQNLLITPFQFTNEPVGCAEVADRFADPG